MNAVPKLLKSHVLVLVLQNVHATDQKERKLLSYSTRGVFQTRDTLLFRSMLYFHIFLLLGLR